MSDNSLVKLLILLAAVYYIVPLWSYGRYLQEHKKNDRGGIAVVFLGMVALGAVLLY